MGKLDLEFVFIFKKVSVFLQTLMKLGGVLDFLIWKYLFLNIQLLLIVL